MDPGSSQGVQPQVCSAAMTEAYETLIPQPRPSVPQRPTTHSAQPTASTSHAYSAALAKRKQVYGPNAPLSYEQPLMAVRGSGTYLYDEAGRAYLDCINNVTHLGHGNEEVAAAVSSQLRTLNTNSRFLNVDLPAYTELLLGTLNRPGLPQALLPQVMSGQGTYVQPTAEQPGLDRKLETLYLVCSGSEANDLALRIIKANRPGATHMAVMAGAYHGHTMALIPLSSYKFWGRGGQGREPHVHVVPLPDAYRGENLDGRAAARAVLAAARRAGARIGGFFAESVLSCGGQIFYPPGYLQGMYDELRREDVVCVADEVQCGFGRCGATFWTYQSQDVRPDIVTMGKPIGNGYPLAALATTRALAGGFAAPGMEYFNTYGGSNAAVAAGLAVLRILLRDGMQAHAEQVGAHLLRALRPLVGEFEVVGDVRGLGLIGGLEIVTDKATKRHAPVIARWIKERMKARQVLISTDGPFENVLKYKPPMVFGARDADRMVQQLREVLSQELTPVVYRRLLADEAAAWRDVGAPRMAHYRDNERQLYGQVSRL